MKTSVILHVEHPDAISAARVAVLVDKMVGIGMQEAHDTIEFDAPEDFEGAREAIQLEVADAELCTVASVSNFSVLKSLCELLYIAEGSDPHDFDEDTQRIFNEAQAARDAVADPCPDCHAREVLCESCGGLGYVPKETKPLRVLCHVTGGVASLAYDPGIEHVIADADEGGPIDIPAGWEDLAEQLDVDTETDPDDAESERWRCSNCGEEGDGNDFCSTKHRETTMVCPGCGSHDVFLQDDEQDD